jgi:hypothetical protein
MVHTFVDNAVAREKPRREIAKVNFIVEVVTLGVVALQMVELGEN